MCEIMYCTAIPLKLKLICTYIVCCHTQHTKPRCKFVITMLKRSWSCWTAVSRILCCCQNSEAKHQWRCRGTWAWAKGEDRDVCEDDWGAWTDWNWHQGVWGYWVEEAASSINWTRNYEDACLLEGDLKVKKRSLLARLQCLICSCHLRRLVHSHLYCRSADMMIHMTHLQSERKCLLLKLPPDGHS